MTAGFTLIADSADGSLAGVPNAEGGALIALGSAGAADGPPAIRWLDRAPRPDDPLAERVIAPAGDGLWRAGAWPAADGLFDMAPSGRQTTIIAGHDHGLRDAVAERASARGVGIEQVTRLDAEGLAGAGCVILAESVGGALPARAFAVLAARRLLVVPRLVTTFGLEDGLDHLEFADPDEAVTIVEAYRRAPEAFARIMTWGRLKAESRRASVVYRRLAADLRLYGLA